MPKHKQEAIWQSIVKYAKENYAGKFTRLDVRFCGKYCYIERLYRAGRVQQGEVAFTDESREEYMERLRDTPTNLFRLLYRGDDDAWELALCTYGNEKYEVSMYPNSTFEGTLEEAFDVGAICLQ